MLPLPEVGKVTIIVAKPGSGKSHLIRYIITKWVFENAIDYAIVFTNTPFNYPYIQKGFVYGAMDESSREYRLKKIVTTQMKYKEKTGILPRALIVFDDCMDYNFNRAYWSRLISEHRQYGLTMIFSIQYLNKGVPPIFRTIATYAIVFKTNDYPSVKSLHDAFMADLGGYREVYHYIQTNTNERYTFILINCDVRAKKKYMVGKAPAELPDVKITFW